MDEHDRATLWVAGLVLTTCRLKPAVVVIRWFFIPPSAGTGAHSPIAAAPNAQISVNESSPAHQQKGLREVSWR